MNPRPRLSWLMASCLLACGGSGSGDASVDSGDRPEAGLDASTDGGRCEPPTHVLFEVEALGGDTVLDAGYTGISHALALNQHTSFVMEVVECDEECRRCRLRGPVASPNPDEPGSRRCSQDTRIECRTDADCGPVLDADVPDGGVPPDRGTCAYMLGSSTEFRDGCACVQIFLKDSEAGATTEAIADLETGALHFARFPISVFLSLGGCSVCEGDDTPLDGVQDGTCTGPTPAEGEACDVSGISPSTRATSSWDCPAGGETQVNFDLPIGQLTTNGVRWSLDATRPRCGTLDAPTDEPCWCGFCGGTGDPCASNAECAAGVACQPPARSADYPSRPNACAESSPCEWDPERQQGTCVSLSDGETVVGCFPGGDGAILEARGEGRRIDDGLFSRVGGLTCLPAIEPFTDVLTGIPGPVRLQVRFNLRPLRGGT